jgi:hypothetical protein
MGALFSGFVGLAAILLGRILGMNRSRADEESASEVAASSAS